jgi:dihydroneopterin aldolase
MVILIIAANLGYLNLLKNIHMKYQTALNNLEFYAYHGLYKEENLLGGRFLVDVLLETETNSKILTINQALNYEIIFSIVKEEMEERRELIETVAQSILSELTKAFTDVDHIMVTISKPNPGGLFGSGVARVSFSA